MQTGDNGSDSKQSCQKVEILPTHIWIESGLAGNQYVMVRHGDERNDSFCYCTLYYDYRYTDNGRIKQQAVNIAISLGAAGPVEFRHCSLEEELQRLGHESVETNMKKSISKKDKLAITINSEPLTDAQATTVRVAIENFDADLKDDYLGEDAHSAEMTKIYRERISEIKKLIFT